VGTRKHNLTLVSRTKEDRAVPQDYAESMKWFRMAAEQGLAEAQNNVGIAYEKGQGVPKDDV